MTPVEKVRLLLDEVGTGTFWTDIQICNALNRAQLQTFSRTPISVSVTTSTEFNTIPSSIFIPFRLIDTTTNQVLPIYTKKRFLREYPDWQLAQTGTPTLAVNWSLNNFKLYPAPSASRTYTLVGLPWPTQLSLATDELALPNGLIEVLMYRAGAYLLEGTLPQLAGQWFNLARDRELVYRRSERNNLGKLERLRPRVR